jgi:adenine-specific DNA-methyltransferase
MSLEIKQQIQNAIIKFNKGDLFENSINLFKTLGYNTERQDFLDKPSFKVFKETYINSRSNFNETKAQVEQWKSIHLLFQLSKAELSKQSSLFDTKRVDNTIIETYLFFAIELTQESYNRTFLAQITREINRLFPMPVMILFKYGSLLTLSVINRRLHKHDDSKDVLEKVTLIKDINIEKPHRAHIEILFDLSFQELYLNFLFTNFVDLHNAWQKTLDTKELNKRFYAELFNWYLWAIRSVSFPNVDKGDIASNSERVIRLLTRLIFIWFIKEKKLVPEQLFDKKFMLSFLKNFNYSSEKTSIYYRAILQNLFFATLNTPMDNDAENGDEKRRFINILPAINNPDFKDQTKFRYKDYFNKPDEVLELFASIPFLNGGLFECLDTIEEGIRYDGFSSTEKSQAFVPDKLFFADEFDYDLNEEYATKGKKYKVEGLINILNSYKFTITENTPLEEEIALDPELLGKVFENLLASYNPETQTTARKQTGSFYTPREIVNYMVDESLIAYLKQKFDNQEEAETKLRNLFKYSDEKHSFNKKETDILIKAISESKILDPACGSAAFPMGVLHRFVYLLSKLDPDNSKWNDLQIERAIAETAEVFHCGDVTEREIRLNEINKAFDLSMNHPDYARKLFLIENCIYGVDIQQIAIQISKLRFFISLIVDQKVENTKPNRNILSMPNLETKFVAANTLVALDKPQQLTISDGSVEQFEKELASIRHKIFFTRKYKAKKELKKKEKAKREELQKALIQSGFNKNTAGQMAGWNPFDPMKSAGFFDPETMFGFNNGFDIIIGNPPYIQIKQIPAADKPYYVSNFKFATGRFNLFYFFIEITEKYTRSHGIATYIVPDRLLLNTQCCELRNWLLNQQTIIELDSFDESVFDSAVVDSIILFYKNIKNTFSEIFAKSNVCVSEINFSNRIKIPISYFTNSPNKQFDLNYSLGKSNLIDKIRTNSIPLGEISDTRDGIIQSKIPDVLFLNKKENKFCKKLLFGKNINRYQLIYDNNWVNYQPDEMMKIELKRDGGGLRLRTKDIFEREKILTRQTADEIIGSLDSEHYYYSNTLHGTAITDKTYDIKFILSLLNSKILSYYYKATTAEGGKVFAQIKIEILRQLPIKKSTNQKPFITIVDKILLSKGKNPQADTSQEENQLDVMIYKLYQLNYDEVLVIDKEFENQMMREDYEKIDFGFKCEQLAEDKSVSSSVVKKGRRRASLDNLKDFKF